jgi:hypothetical protein
MRHSPQTTPIGAALRQPVGPPGTAAAQHVAVDGLGDLEMGRLFAPAVNTIRVHGAAMGRAAAKLALDQTKPRRVYFGFELVLGDCSWGAGRTTRPARAAQRNIRGNVEPIGKKNPTSFSEAGFLDSSLSQTSVTTVACKRFHPLSAV